MKKFLALLLSLSMLVVCTSAISLVAFAEGEDVTVGSVTISQDADGYYIIDSAEKFEAVFGSGNTTNSELLTGGKKFKQTAPFTLSATYFPVHKINNVAVPFAGTYDGNNCTITIPSDWTTSSNNFGLFRDLKGATIKNLTVDGTITAPMGWLGIFAGNVTASSDNTFENCINSVDITSGQAQIAGFVTSVKGNLSFINCVNEGNITAKKTAGFVYNTVNNNTITFKNCTNKGNITGKDVGTAGFMTTTALGANKASFTGCENNGNISGTSFVAGFLTGTVAIYNPASFENCTNNGSVTGTSNQVGGFVTRIDNSTFKSCKNTGAITGAGDTGGFMGQSVGKFEKCINSGTITVKTNGKHAGGFIGGVNGTNDGVEFTLCANTGDVVAYGKAGGFIPFIGVAAEVVFDRCYNEGNINAWDARGGFIGQAQGYATGKAITINIKDCYNAGYIQGSNPSKGSLIGLPDSATDSVTITIDNFYDILNPDLDIIGVAKANASTFITYNDIYLLNALNDYTYGVAVNAEVLSEVPAGFTQSAWALVTESGYPYIQLTENIYTPGNDVTVKPVSGTSVYTGTSIGGLLEVDGILNVKTPYAIVAAKFAYNNTAVLDDLSYGVLISETVSGDELNVDTCDYKATGSQNTYGRYGILIYGESIESDKTYYVRPYVEYNGKYWYGTADEFAFETTSEE